jgi:histo-blood group ABO system transferase
MVEAMSTALIIIATRPRYWKFAEDLIASAKKFFVPHDVILFTDREEPFDVCYQFTQEPLGYPDATLYRYHIVLSQRDLLSKYDNIFYGDADALFVAPVEEEDIFSEGITATVHSGYHVQNQQGSPERNPESAAYLPHLCTYFCGGFNGGTSEAYLKMAEVIRQGVDSDKAKGIVAVWHDESHLNRYLFDHPPALVLSPSFCYPESYTGNYGWPASQYKPIFMVLEKRGQR